MRLPSIKKLREVFGDRAKEARAVLEMSRSQLEEHPVGEARARECCHPPSTSYIRMTVLDSIAGTCGVESIKTRHGWCDYLNAGDAYAPTLVRFRGRYRIGSWGDIAERHGAE